MIAVALFAGLSYTVTNSMKGGGKSIEGDKHKLAALHIINMANDAEKGVNRLVMVNDCQATQIDFSPASSGANGNAPADYSCHLFDPRGGQITYSIVPAKYTTETTDRGWGVFSGYAYSGVGSTCSNTSCNELVYYLRDLTKDVCLAINNALSVTNPSGDAPVVGDMSAGSISNNGHNGVISTAQLVGKTSACVKEAGGCGSGTCYAYYHVLYAR